MDVDPDNGAIYVIFYDTRDDPGRKKAHVYYVRSGDGGNSWVDESRVTTTFTDETASPADLGNQYGDYNGLVAYRAIAHPVWTDRRSGVPGNKEQIFTARIGDSGPIILAMHPSNIKLDDPGETALIIATLTDPGGSPVANVNVEFSSDHPNIAQVTPPIGVTNTVGAVQATVKGLNRGETDIEAKAQNQSVKTHVKVPDLSLIGFVFLVICIILFEPWCRRFISVKQ
jgi:hypothetical protein